MQVPKGSGTQTEPVPESSTAPCQATGDKPPTLFSMIRDVALLVGIYAYFSGWIYVFSYYRQFDVPLNHLDIPSYYFIVYAFSALYNFWGVLIVLFALLTLVFFARRERPHPIIVPLVLLLLFPILFRHASNEAVNDAYEDRFSSDNDRVVLSFRAETEKNYPSELVANNNANRLRFLTEGKDFVVVFYQPPGEGGATPLLLVYDISKQDLAGVKKLIAHER